MKQTNLMSEPKSSLVDLSQIINISAGDNLFIREMIDMYLNLLNKEMEKIYTAVAIGDTETLKGLIHKIKPNLKIFGLMEIAELLIEIEEEAAKGVLHKDIIAKISKVKTLNDQVINELTVVRENFDLNG